MIGGSVETTDWEEAWSRASKLLEGTRRFRVSGATPDVEIAVIDFGGAEEGPLVVMHHANGFCGATLAQVARGLTDRFRVVALDARGQGDSTPVAPGGEPDPYDWDTLSVDLEGAVLGVLEHVGRERVHLGIGHSFGGALFLRAANRMGKKIERLLLCDPVILPALTPEQKAARSGGPSLATLSRKRRDHFPDFAGAYEHCRTRGLFRNFTPESLALYCREAMRPIGSGDGAEVTLKCHRDVEAAIFEGGATHASLGKLENVTARVVFVHALRGNFQASYYEEIARSIADAVVVSEDVGHLFPLEEPERVLELIESYF